MPIHPILTSTSPRESSPDPSSLSYDASDIMTVIRDKQWDQVKTRTLIFPKEATRRYLIQTQSGMMENGTICHPLHMACVRQPPISVIVSLLDACLQANKEKDATYGRLPLHFACRFGASLEVIMLLAALYPDSIKIPAKDGSLPLHLACRYRRTSIGVIKYLVRNYPASVNVKDHKGYVPLDVASANEMKMAIHTIMLVVQEQRMKRMSRDMELLNRSISDLKLRAGHVLEQDREMEESNAEDRNETIQTVTVARSRSETKMCVVCMVQSVNHVIVPCGHVCLCQDCAGVTAMILLKWKCPECRGEINEVHRIYGRIVDD